MNLNRRHFVGAAVAATAGLSSGLLARSTPLPARIPSPLTGTVPPPAPQVAAVAKAAEQPALLAQAVAAMNTHAAYIGRRDKIGLVDFTLASRERRFWLVDVEGGKIEHTWLVAHGKGSDEDNTGFVQRFSNQPGSNASSRGAYCTSTPYYGKHGRSQRLIGLDPENNAALDRAIVIHGAPYVDPELASDKGVIGRSWGCFAVETSEIDRVMGALGEGRLLYAGKSA